MLKCDFNKVIEITFRHGCSPVNLLHIFRTPFSRNTSGWMLLLKFGEMQFTANIWKLGRVANIHHNFPR